MRNYMSLERLLGDWKLIAVSVGIGVIVAVATLAVLQLARAIDVPFATVGKDIVNAAIPLVVTILGFSALVILGWALRNQFMLRAREIEHLEALAEADAVRRQGEYAQTIQLRLSGDFGDSDEERRALIEELATATERYYVVLGGYIRARPEIARIERDAIVTYLAEADAELRRMRAPGYEPSVEISQEPLQDTPLSLPASNDARDNDNSRALEDGANSVSDASPAQEQRLP